MEIKDIQKLKKNDKIDKLLFLVQNISTLVPTLGGVLSNIFGGISTDRKFNRITEVLTNLAQDISNLGKKSGSYIISEDFEEILEESLLKIARERNDEKRILYKNMLLKTIDKNISYEEFQQTQFFETLGKITKFDIIFIKAILQEPSDNEVINIHTGSYFGTLKMRTKIENEKQIEDVINHLNILKITNINSLNTMIPVLDARNMKNGITQYGRDFLDFIEFK